MEKIGILTFFRAGNYGGDLQAYALQQKLHLMGYDVEVINQLRPGFNEEYISTPNFQSLISKSKRTNIKVLIYNTLYSFLSFILFKKKDKLRKFRFNNFEEVYIRTSQKVFYNFDELYSSELLYDIYITGSDQVWNYSYPFSLEPYFLTFVKQKKKIAYAASIGHDFIPEEIKPLYKKWLNNIDFISTREKHAEQLVKVISGKDAITVLDPTFLFTKQEWINHLKIKKIEIKPFLLIYIMGNSPYISKLAHHIAKIKKLQIKRIVPQYFMQKCEKNIINIHDAGPIEFVELFANASYVLTNSFHGTAFSINFNIPFFSVLKKSTSTKSRQISILNITRLSHRLLYEGSEFPNLNELDLDYHDVNKILDNERKRSIAFLTNAITCK